MPPMPSREDVEALARYADVLDRPAEELYEWRSPEEDEDGTPSFPFVSYKPLVMRFLDDVLHRDFLIDFDWPAWQGKALRLQTTPGALEDATLDDLRKLLTVHIRKHRFVEGHLAQALDEGWIQAILRRLRLLLPEGED